MTAHSLLVGGSIAARRLNCPASFQESLKQPQGERVSSVYADRGTALHEVMSSLIFDADSVTLALPDALALSANTLHPTETLTQDDIDIAIMPALQALDDLMSRYGGNFRIAANELEVQFPGIQGAFGTLDLILLSTTYALLIDYKFGQGVPVAAIYPDPVNGDIVNEQLSYYAAAALHGRPELFHNRRIVLAIVQPAFEPPYTEVEVGLAELHIFVDAVHDAIANALTAKPRRARGEWCRFAECKATCPLWTGPLLNLSTLMQAIPAGSPQATALQRAMVPPHQDWGNFLASAKRLVDSAIQYKSLIDVALIEHLRSGGGAPGYALKPAVKDRRWIDDATEVANVLAALGFQDHEIWQRKLQTFKSVDTTAKRRKVTIPERLRPKPLTTDMVLTAEDDPKAIVYRELDENFRAALAALKPA